MVASRASASKKEAPTTVSTSLTTLPIVLEVADAPASMCEHMVVGERAGTAGKGQTESRWHMPCSMSGRARAQRFGAGACAPLLNSSMPTSSRPAIVSLHAACHGTRESLAGRERHAESPGFSSSREPTRRRVRLPRVAPITGETSPAAGCSSAAGASVHAGAAVTHRAARLPSRARDKSGPQTSGRYPYQYVELRQPCNPLHVRPNQAEP